MCKLLCKVQQFKTRIDYGVGTPTDTRIIGYPMTMSIWDLGTNFLYPPTYYPLTANYPISVKYPISGAASLPIYNVIYKIMPTRTY